MSEPRRDGFGGDMLGSSVKGDNFKNKSEVSVELGHSITDTSGIPDSLKEVFLELVKSSNDVTYEKNREIGNFINLIRSAKPDEIKVAMELYKKIKAYKETTEWARIVSENEKSATQEEDPTHMYHVDHDEFRRSNVKDLTEKVREFAAELDGDSWLKKAAEGEYVFRPILDYSPDQIQKIGQLSEINQPIDNMDNVNQAFSGEEKDEIIRRLVVGDTILDLLTDNRRYLSSYQDQLPSDATSLQYSVNAFVKKNPIDIKKLTEQFEFDIGEV